VFELSVEEPLRALHVGPGYFKVVLVVRSQGRVLGHIALPALEVVPVDVQRAAIAERLAPVLWEQEALAAVRRACGQEPAPPPPCPPVSVVVCTRDRPEDLVRCLESVASLRTRPLEVLVVDNCPSDEQTRHVCEAFPVRYLLEPLPGQSRARNRGILESRGELVAFTDDDCVVDAAWLDGLGAEVSDPLALAFTGYVGPLELETPSQFLFEAHGGFDRGFRRRVFHGVWTNPALVAGRVGAGANAIFRRDAFERIGLFAEDLGPGTPARAADDTDIFCRILDAGYRIAFDPARVVWHRHRRDEHALRRIVSDYGVSSSAFAARRLGRHRDPSALRILTWWWLEHGPSDLAALVRGRPARLPARAIAAELAGTLRGPWALMRSRRSRREIAPLAAAKAPKPAHPALVAVGAEPASFSVVVPSRDRRDSLRRLLESLAAQRFPAHRTEVVVVLDGSTDGSAELVRSLALPYRLTMVETEGEGVAVARNRGLHEASEPLVLFLDDDIVPEPGCLAAHALAHREAPTDRVVLGYCPPVVGESWWGQMVRAWWEDHYRRKLEPRHRWTYYDFVTGNTSLARSLLLDLGGFDELFGARHEDWELAVRLLERGASFTFCADTTAPHHLDTSFPRAARHQRLEASGDVLLGRRHPTIVGQLPLAGFANGLPAATEEGVRRGLVRAERLERLRLRTRWRRQATTVLRDAYVLGLRDELGSDDAFQDLLASAPPPHQVDLRLDGAGAPPALPSLGSVKFVLRDRGEAIARVSPIPPGRQWDWREAVEHTAAACFGPLSLALFRWELDSSQSPGAEGLAFPDVGRVP
jgi:glycosyltransferase involved in cell wall biosynthesis